jgi:hypothetical protein
MSPATEGFTNGFLRLECEGNFTASATERFAIPKGLIE